MSQNKQEVDEQKKEAIYEIVDSILIIHVNGELDHHNSLIIRKNADHYIFHNKIINVIFDFSGTNFMDSSGIGVIMGRYKMVKGIGGNVGVVNVGNNIKKILLFSGVNKIIQYYESLTAAINNLNSKRANENGGMYE